MNDYKEVERITELHKRYAKKPTDPVERFIHEIGFLDERYKGYKFADKWMMATTSRYADRRSPTAIPIKSGVALSGIRDSYL